MRTYFITKKMVTLASYGSFLSERPLSSIAPRICFRAISRFTTCSVTECRGCFPSRNNCKTNVTGGSNKASGVITKKHDDHCMGKL